MIYFTSDLHLGHRGIIELCDSPFESVDEMDQTLIRNWNSIVNENDTVYFLGDLTHKLTVSEANEIIRTLNGKKVLIKGNHDKGFDEILFEEICAFKEVTFNSVSFSLMHYTMLSWPKSHRGSIHLHGHMHNKQEYNLKMKEEGIRRYDVGVDANYYTPVLLQTILSFLEFDK